MKSLKWILENFGALLVFQTANYMFGFKTAIIASLVFATVQLIALKVKKRPITPFILFTFALVLAFGAIDIYLGNSVLTKYEASIFSMIMAGYFGISLLREKSIVEEFAERQGRVTTEKTEDKTFFFRLVTSIWTIYFISKAIFLFWISTDNSIGVSFIYRALFGTASFYILLGLTIGLSQQFWDFLTKAKLMPSQRPNKKPAI